MGENREIVELRNLLMKSQYTVVLTGAGMSTESGLPDFRSANGLWKNRNPAEIASVSALQHNRDEFIQFYRWRIEQLQQFTPHIGHERLTVWQRQGFLQSIVTQNVDGFHQQATSHRVIELHGTLRKIHCMNCQSSYPSERYLMPDGTNCPQCSGFLRPSLILFGEPLDEGALHHALEEARKAELFIVMGSSLQVSPANLLPQIAVDHGADLVIINEDETPLDSYAQLTISGKIGRVLSQIEL